MRFSEFLSKYNEESIFENIIFDRTNRVIRWAGVPRKELEKDRVHGTSPDTIFRIELKPLNYARFPGALYSSFRYHTADKGMSGENVAKTATDANVSNYQLDVLRALKGRNPRNHLFNFTFASDEDRTRIIEKCAQDLIMVIKTRNVKIVFGPDATPVANPAARNGLVQELIAVARRLNPTVMNGVVMLDSIFKKRIVQRDADGNFSDEVCSSFIARDRNTYQIALLWEVNQLEGLKRLHWTAAHPLSMTDEVIHVLTLPKQVNYLHLPVQSGSNEVLRRMNRKYTREQFLEVIRKVKAARPGIALGSDIIVGFPGETPEQFQETISLYREVDFDISYNAQYSPRSGTLGVKLFQDDVSKEEKALRWRELQAVMEDIALRKNQAFLDQKIPVLIDRVEGGFANGNSHDMKLCRIATKDESLVGKLVMMHVKEARTWTLEGELVSSS